MKAKQKEQTKEQTKENNLSELQQLKFENSNLKTKLFISNVRETNTDREEYLKRERKKESVKRLGIVVLTIIFILIAVCGFSGADSIVENNKDKLGDLPSNITTYNSYGDTVIYTPYVVEHNSSGIGILALMGLLLTVVSMWLAMVGIFVILEEFIFPNKK